MADDVRHEQGNDRGEQQKRDIAAAAVRNDKARLFDSIDRALHELMPEFVSSCRELKVRPLYAFDLKRVGITVPTVGYKVQVWGIWVGAKRSGQWFYLNGRGNIQIGISSGLRITRDQARDAFSGTCMADENVKERVRRELTTGVKALADYKR